MQFHLAATDAFIIEFDSTISLETSLKVKFYYETLKTYEGVIDLTPSYTTLLVTFDIFKTSYEEFIQRVQSIKYEENEIISPAIIHKIPVYYGKEVGIDLERIALHHQLSMNEVIQLHTQTTYHVYAIGFAPGFAYLGEVSSKIAMPRLQTPRKSVPKGAVAIANVQTAIYPQTSPGGWNIIGKTSVDMFDKSLNSLCAVNMGDKVQFEAICKEAFLDSGGTL